MAPRLGLGLALKVYLNFFRSSILLKTSFKTCCIAGMRRPGSAINTSAAASSVTLETLRVQVPQRLA